MSYTCGRCIVAQNPCLCHLDSLVCIKCGKKSHKPYTVLNNISICITKFSHQDKKFFCDGGPLNEEYQCYYSSEVYRCQKNKSHSLISLL